MSLALDVALRGISALNHKRDLGTKVDQQAYEQQVHKMINLWFKEMKKINQ